MIVIISTEQNIWQSKTMNFIGQTRNTNDLGSRSKNLSVGEPGNIGNPFGTLGGARDSTKPIMFKYLCKSMGQVTYLSGSAKINFTTCRIMMLPHNRRSAAGVYLAALACTDNAHLLFTVHKWVLGRFTYR